MFIHTVMAVVLGSAVLAEAGQVGIPRSVGVNVRVYDTVIADHVERQAALDAAAAILSIAAVHVTWQVCDHNALPLAAPESSVCDTAMPPGQLMIRIVASPARSRLPGRLPLGDAFVDRGTDTGVLATAYFDRITQMAQIAAVDRRVLLGRVLAHEVGHLLLGTSEHGADGLMRGSWSQDDLRHGRPEDWRFTPLERELMKVDGATVATASSSLETGPREAATTSSEGPNAAADP